MTKVVLLSIKPRWADAILNGEKKWEYRKKLPNLSTPYDMLLYATLPKQKIVGEVTVDKIIRGSVQEVIDETIEDTPNTASEIEEYFSTQIDGYAINVEDNKKYNEPITIDHRPPINFMYVEKEDIVG